MQDTTDSPVRIAEFGLDQLAPLTRVVLPMESVGNMGYNGFVGLIWTTR